MTQSTRENKDSNQDPTYSVDQNHSILTAVSADTNAILEQGPVLTNSPVTSPLAIRSAKENKISGIEKVHESLKSKFEETLLNRSEELISIMKELSNSVQAKDWNSKGAQLYRNDGSLDWKALIEISEKIFNEYSLNMEQITKEFDEFNRVCMYP